MKISVALCTYNGIEFLESQLESILNQTVPVDEVIVCDDGSIDNTKEILHQFKAKNPKRVSIHSNEKNLGIVKNFEKAISLCSGDLIFLSDQDDIWKNNKVETVINFFNKNQSCYAVFSDAELVDEKQKPLHKTLWEFLQFEGVLALNRRLKMFQYLLLYGNVVTGACLTIKKEALSYILPFPDHGKIFHDGWIALRLAEIDKIEFINEPLIQYRFHSRQRTSAIWQYSTEETKKLRLSILEQNVYAFPFQYHIYWKKQLTLLNQLSDDGICINDSIFKIVRANIRKGLQERLRPLPFYQRKLKLVKTFLKREGIAFVDIIKI